MLARPPVRARRTGHGAHLVMQPAISPSRRHDTDGDDEMTQMDAPSGNPGGRDLPDTPATPADVLRWACDVGWSSPFVDVSQARDEEWGSIRVVFAEVTETSLTITLDNGQ